MATERTYKLKTPLESIIDTLERFNSEHPVPCHCSTCHAVIEAKTILQEEARVWKVLKRVYEYAEIEDENSTAIKHDKETEPEVADYHQGRADMARLVVSVIQETYRGDDFSE